MCTIMFYKPLELQYKSITNLVCLVCLLLLCIYIYLYYDPLIWMFSLYIYLDNLSFSLHTHTRSSFFNLLTLKVSKALHASSSSKATSTPRISTACGEFSITIFNSRHITTLLNTIQLLLIIFIIIQLT